MNKVFMRIRQVSIAVGGGGLLILVIAWMAGVFNSKIAPGESATALADHAMLLPPEAVVVFVEAQITPIYVRAPGTVRALQETAVGSRLLAPVLAVHIRAGQHVETGEVLIELDKADLVARERRTEADLAAGQARFAKVEDDLKRVRALQANDAATPQELFDAERNVEVARADVNSLEQGRAEVVTQLQYATITAPFAGIVIDKNIDVGDLARPGETLVTLYNPKRLQLEADVPESVALHLSPGDEVGVQLQALDLFCVATISEIVPQASPATRSLLVKVVGPCPPGVVSGMFGRLIIQTGTRRQLLIPNSAVERVGQLEFVYIVNSDDAAAPMVRKRFVKSGAEVEDMVEIISGLAPGESIVTNPQIF